MNKIFPLSIALFLFSLTGLHAQSDAQNTVIENVSFFSYADSIIVEYSLIGPSEKTFDIGLVLKNQADPDFEYTPRLVRGSIGEGQSPGQRKRIIWDFTEEVGDITNNTDFRGLPPDQYYFIVSTELDEGGFPILIVGGAALVAGGIVALLIGGGDDGGGGDDPVVADDDFPSPPPLPGKGD